MLAFWRDAGPDKWFKKDPAFDAEITARFLPTYEAAAAGRLSGWEATADGALALLIVLDQFPRNMFRGQARTYAADALAREVADRAIARGFDRDVADVRAAVLLPAVHAFRGAGATRSAASRCRGNMATANSPSMPSMHADIIRRFGRFPHRNALLGRITTPEEQAFLDGGGFAG